MLGLRKPRSIKTKLYFILSLSLAGYVLQGVYFYYHEKAGWEARISEKGVKTNDFLAKICATHIQTFDYVSIINYIADLKKDKEIAYVVVWKSDGKPITREEAGIRASFDGAVDIKPVVSDISYYGKEIGKIETGISLATMNAEVRKSLNQLLLVSAMQCVIVIVLVFIIRGVIRPVRSLTNRVNGIARDVLGSEVPIEAKDEITQLALAFDQMVGRVSEYHRSLLVEVDEHKQAEESLKESEHRLRSILDSIQTGVVLIEADENRIVDVNPKASEMIGAAREDIIGHVCHNFICPAEIGKCPVKNLGQLVDNSERKLKRAGGELVPILKTVNQVKLNGRTHFIESIVDITDRKRAEEALRREEKYRGIFENIIDGYYRSDLDGHIIMVSPSGCKMLGYECDAEVIGMHIGRDLFTDPGRLDILLKELRKKGAVNNFEVALKKKDGTFLDVDVNCHLVKNGQGTPEGVEGVFRDVTQRKLAEEERKKLEGQLRQSQKMEAIGTLAGGIAHDFNNILFSIIGFTEMAAGALNGHGRAKTYMDEVLSAAKRARDLIQQILTFSRRGNQERGPLSMQPVIKEVIKLLRASLPSTIDIREDIDQECGIVIADPTQIHQVIMNLCTNAHHSMRATGGVIEIALRQVDVDRAGVIPAADLRPGTYARLTVADTGHGMAPDVRNRAFEPYFTTKTPGEGTGMGLSVVHGIVKTCGGDVTVESEPGKGSTFHVYLPVIDASCEAPQTASSRIPETGNREHILFVDDEEQLVRMMQAMLEGLGYHVTARTSSVEALEAFRAQPQKFDLVITDQTMPNMTGMDLAQALFRIRPDIPVILCTGFSELVTEERARDMGIRQFIMKPVVRSELAGIVRKVLYGRERRRT